ncbi:hypothetical protein [Streptomyces sp. TR06-5]|uniref:hypothetical protein n=1 Tax=Streptomyces sp. TR06-5 TaxID=3385976 RepID=UPI0039A22235
MPVLTLGGSGVSVGLDPGVDADGDLALTLERRVLADERRLLRWSRGWSDHLWRVPAGPVAASPSACWAVPKCGLGGPMGDVFVAAFMVAALALGACGIAGITAGWIMPWARGRVLRPMPYGFSQLFTAGGAICCLSTYFTLTPELFVVGDGMSTILHLPLRILTAV